MNVSEFRSQPFDLAVDTISDRDIEELSAWVRQYPRLTMAGETKGFERTWARWLGVKYCVMCNSGSSANLLMYAALDATGRSRTRRIVVPSAGWVTTIAPALQFSWRPFMCEAAADTFGLDLDHLSKLLRKHKPETVILVHELGVPNDMTAIKALQEEYGFQLLEDCCAGHGARHRGRKVGTFSCMSSFSFYYGHHMSTVEGGMVCTDDEELYHALLMLRSHGWLKDLPRAKANRIMRQHGVDPFHMPFTFVLPGFNLRPTDIAAKMGMIQLSGLDRAVERRAANHLIYQDLLDGSFEFARAIPGDYVSSISFCALAASTEERRRVLRSLDHHRIDTRIFSAGNLGRHPFWSVRYGVFSAPMADKLYERGFFLPNNPSLDRSGIEFICSVARKAKAAGRGPRR